MSETFARHTIEQSDRYAQQANARLGELASELPRIGPEALMTYSTQVVSDLVGETARLAAMMAQQEIDAAMRAQGRRAFAGPLDVALSDFYSTYLPQLVGDWAARERRLLMDRLARGERDRVPQGTTAAEIAQEFGLSYGRGNTIVRTESTRAASMARRFVALRQIEGGRGPDAFIYKSLLDPSVTQTCRARHNVAWRVADDRMEWWPPQHFNCRAGVIFAWEGDPSLENARWMNAVLEMSLTQVQRQEFPTWQSNRIAGPVLRVPGRPGAERDMPEIRQDGLARLDAMRQRLVGERDRQDALAQTAQELETARQQRALEDARRQLVANRIRLKLRR